MAYRRPSATYQPALALFVQLHIPRVDQMDYRLSMVCIAENNCAVFCTFLINVFLLRFNQLFVPIETSLKVSVYNNNYQYITTFLFTVVVKQNQLYKTHFFGNLSGSHLPQLLIYFVATSCQPPQLKYKNIAC